MPDYTDKSLIAAQVRMERRPRVELGCVVLQATTFPIGQRRIMEYPARIELALALLQSAALPLGYGYEIGVVSPTATSATQGLQPLLRSRVYVNARAFQATKLVPGSGLEPAWEDFQSPAITRLALQALNSWQLCKLSTSHTLTVPQLQFVSFRLSKVFRQTDDQLGLRILCG